MKPITFTTSILSVSVIGAALLTLGSIGFSSTPGEMSKIAYTGNLWCVSNWIEEEDAQGNKTYLPSPDGRAVIDHRLKGREDWMRLDQVSAETKEEAETNATRIGLFEPSEKVALRESLDKNDIAFFTSHFNTGATHPGPCVGSGMGTGIVGTWINDSIRKDCFDIDSAPADSSCGFDRSKLQLYSSGGGADPGAKYAETDEAKKYAIDTLNVDQAMIKKFSRSEVENMIRAEITKQFQTLSNKLGSTQQDAQQAILSYQLHESSSFQLFDDSLKPSYTHGSSGDALNIMSLTNDKFSSKNKRVGASYDIKYAIYLGVKENMDAFASSRVSGTGKERWHNSIGYVFLPSDPNRYWTDSRSNAARSAWTIYANETAYTCPSAATQATTPNQATAPETSTQTSCGAVKPSLVDSVSMLPANNGKLGREQHLTNTKPTHYNGTNSQPVAFAGNGAFSPHTTEQEHWYITSQWPYADYSTSPARRIHSPAADAISSNIKHARLVIKSVETGKMMVVSAEESGPRTFVTARDGINYGGPPEVYKGLGLSDAYTGNPKDNKGRIQVLGFTVDQSTKLGPCK